MPPRTRISEAPQRISTRDPLHHRPITERSPRLLGDRRSPRGSQSDPLNQRRLGTRISDLESQLVQAQRELKNLKQQLSSADSANNDGQGELYKKTKNNPEQFPQETHKETDVFEVPMEKLSVEPVSKLEDAEGMMELKELSSKVPLVDELENASLEQPELKKTEMDQLKEKLETKEKEFEEAIQENEILKKQLVEVNSEISATRVKEEEMVLKYTELEKDLKASNAAKSELMKKLEETDTAKEELEVEMKKLRVQTEQWRKAADAAASVLAGEGVEVSGGWVSQRCGSMEKHFNSVFEPPLIGGYPGYLGSPGADDDLDDAFGNGKRKGSGIRKLGDLWKKKGHK